MECVACSRDFAFTIHATGLPALLMYMVYSRHHGDVYRYVASIRERWLREHVRGHAAASRRPEETSTECWRDLNRPGRVSVVVFCLTRGKNPGLDAFLSPVSLRSKSGALK